MAFGLSPSSWAVSNSMDIVLEMLQGCGSSAPNKEQDEATASLGHGLKICKSSSSSPGHFQELMEWEHIAVRYHCIMVCFSVLRFTKPAEQEAKHFSTDIVKLSLPPSYRYTTSRLGSLRR